MHIRNLLLLACAAALSPQAPASTWQAQTSGVSARLRGVSAVSAQVAWASGAGGTVLRTTDGGARWQRLTVPDSASLDFRDVDALSDRTAYVLSIGPGEASRVFKTTDGGATWTLQFANEDPKVFLDAMAFRDERRGFAFSDSVDGQFVILKTENGGTSWTRLPASALPPALEGEGAFAASGTNVAVLRDHVWIGTTRGRVLHSSNSGRTWSIAGTPLATGASAGIFSIAFRDARRGIVVGGDYRKEAEAVDNVAITSDGGATWTLVKERGLSGFRSVVAWVPTVDNAAIAVGPSGADWSHDGGRNWTPLSVGPAFRSGETPAPVGPTFRPGESHGFHAFAFAPGTSTGWGVGESGRIGRLQHITR